MFAPRHILPAGRAALRFYRPGRCVGVLEGKGGRFCAPRGRVYVHAAPCPAGGARRASLLSPGAVRRRFGVQGRPLLRVAGRVYVHAAPCPAGGARRASPLSPGAVRRRFGGQGRPLLRVAGRNFSAKETHPAFILGRCRARRGPDFSGNAARTRGAFPSNQSMTMSDCTAPPGRVWRFPMARSGHKSDARQKGGVHKTVLVPAANPAGTVLVKLSVM